jgi:predicted Zn-dependent protease
LLVLVVCLLFQASFVGQAQALDFGKLLGEVGGALNRVTATVNRTIGGVNEDNQKLLDQSRAQAPATNAFLGKWEQSWEVSMGEKTHESLKKDHEMGHVDKKHSVRQAEKSGLMTALVIGMGLYKKTQKAAPIAAIAAYFANLKFSRDDEYEADACAVKYMHASGYNPQGLLTFFDKINRDSKASKVTKYFSTHPPTTDRINAVKKQIASLPARASAPTAGEQMTVINKPDTTSTSSSSGNTTWHTAPSQTSNTPTSTARPTNQQIQAAYEAYLYHQQNYQYKVQQQAPMNEIMDAFSKYQKAKEHYMSLRKAAGM